MTGAAKILHMGTLTPKQLAALCEAHPDVDRVELDGHHYRVFPKDLDARPVFFSSLRFGRSGMCENTLRDLRRSGIDVERPPAPPAPKTTPKATTPPREDATVSAVPSEPLPTPRVIGPVMTQREGAELRDMVRKASDATVAMLAEADGQMRELRATIEAQGRTIETLRREVAGLRGEPLAKPPSTAELVRRAVWAWFEAHPGTKWTPQVIELNIGDDLPQPHPTTAVANACKDLATAGKIEGGATRDRAQREKGIYWLPLPAAEPEPER